MDGDGLYDDATGQTPTFSPERDGTYTVTLQVTDDDGDADTATAQVNATRVEAIDMGVADFTRRSGLNLAESNVWYQITTTRAGVRGRPKPAR